MRCIHYRRGGPYVTSVTDFQDRRRDVSFRALLAGRSIARRSPIPSSSSAAGLAGSPPRLALAQRGIASRVLEGAPEFGAIGYGIQFGPNVFHVLDRIGVTAAVMEKADCPPAVLMRDALTGDELVRIPTGASFRGRFKHPYIIVHRIDLHNALLDACRRAPEIELVPDAMVTAFRGTATTASRSPPPMAAASRARRWSPPTASARWRAPSSSATASRARSAMSRTAPSCRCRS